MRSLALTLLYNIASEKCESDRSREWKKPFVVYGLSRSPPLTHTNR